MIPVISPKCMQTYDDITCKKENITSFELMTRAAYKLKNQFLHDFKNAVNHVLIVAGLGNNGGDGMMMGHFLKKAGIRVTLFCVGNVSSMRSEAKDALDNYKAYETIKTAEDIDKLTTAAQEADMVIDAVFGLGLTRDIEGIYVDVIKELNTLTLPILSIDFPSGIDPYSGRVRNIAVKAKYTYIIQTYKYGNLLHDALDYHGIQTVVDIGIEITKAEGTLLDHKTILPRVMHRKHNSHKYDYGSVLIVGGSKTMMGAPNLSSLAALRSGAGLVTIAYDDTAFKYRAMSQMEVMHIEYTQDTINDNLNNINVIAFGIGLGKNNESHKGTLKTLLQTPIPMVIDADGLYYYQLIKDDVRHDKPVVLTPHFGELLRLLDCDKETFYKSWVDQVKTFVKTYDVNLLLKGPVSVIITKDHMAFSAYGNAGMATAGSGDVLTGILSSRIGQNSNFIEALQEGLVLHGLCGDIAKNKTNAMSMIASDIIEALTQLTKQQ
ncbi:MAG: NAD(P)H-hydrate dehydratase [Bacillota bacterium]